jgi:PAS domain S-box-containing protein
MDREELTLLERHGLTVGLWLFTPESGCFVASSTWARMLGLPPKSVDGGIEVWLGRVLPGDRPRLEANLRILIDGVGSEFSCEYRLRPHHGPTRWMRAVGRAHVRSNGAASIYGHQLDITEQKEREMSARRSEERFRALVQSSPDAIAIHRQGKFVYANDRMLSLVGCSRESELIGRSIFELVHPASADLVSERLRTLNPPGRGERLPFAEVRLLHKDGDEVLCEMSSVVLDFDGRPAVFEVVRDLTEMKRFQDRLAEADKMAGLGTLAAAIAHEINNPLAYISASLEGMLSDLPALFHSVEQLRASIPYSLEPAALEARLGRLFAPDVLADFTERLQDALQGSARVQAIVADLKRFTRNEADLPRGPVQVERAVRSALKMAQHELKHRGRVVEAFDQVAPVLADERRLAQVFLNLFINAAHALDSARCDENEVRVRVHQEGERVVIEVADNGRGIAKEHQGRLFDPFFTTKPAGMGTGLGLPICQHIVQSFGGRIQVQSELGHGTRVVVEFPAVEGPEVTLPATPALRAASRANGKAGSGTVVAAQPPARSANEVAPESTPLVVLADQLPRVLVVDDEPALLRALRRELGREFSVTTAQSGEEALRLLSSNQSWEFVLCDFSMSPVSGKDVYAWIEGHRPWLLDRLLFITGGATSIEGEAFLRAHADSVVTKPVRMEELRKIFKERLAESGPLRTERPPAPERRKGPRVRAWDVSGVLNSKHGVAQLGAKVVDYSHTGVRFGRFKAGPQAETVFGMQLFRAGVETRHSKPRRPPRRGRESRLI